MVRRTRPQMRNGVSESRDFRVRAARARNDEKNPFESRNLPDGQITSCFPKWLVQPLLQKYFCFGPRQISSLIRAVSSQGGAIARRHERGAGCGGRESVRRCQGMAGRVDTARELANGTRTNGALADGKAVWFWHPLLVLNPWRLVGPTGLGTSL